MYRSMPSQIDLPACEQELLEVWRESELFHRSLAGTRTGTP